MYSRSKIFEVLNNISDNKSNFEDDFGENKNAFDADSEQFVDIEDAKDFQ